MSPSRTPHSLKNNEDVYQQSGIDEEINQQSGKFILKTNFEGRKINRKRLKNQTLSFRQLEHMVKNKSFKSKGLMDDIIEHRDSTPNTVRVENDPHNLQVVMSIGEYQNLLDEVNQNQIDDKKNNFFKKKSTKNLEIRKLVTKIVEENADSASDSSEKIEDNSKRNKESN